MNASKRRESCLDCYYSEPTGELGKQLCLFNPPVFVGLQQVAPGALAPQWFVPTVNSQSFCHNFKPRIVQ